MSTLTIPTRDHLIRTDQPRSTHQASNYDDGGIVVVIDAEDGETADD